MTASKIVKNAIPSQSLDEVVAKINADKKVLLSKLEILQAKTRLIQEQLDLLEFGLGTYKRPTTHN